MDFKGFSIYYWFGYPIPPLERLKLIKAAGFDGTFFWWGDEFDNTDGKKELLPDLARQAGLIVENMHIPFGGTNCLWEDNLTGDAIEGVFSDAIRACARHAIPTAIMHTSYGNNPIAVNQTGFDRFKRLAELAEENNVNIALENTRQPATLDAVFNAVSSDRLRFCYDSGHEHCYTKGIDCLARYGSKLIALHLHDNDGIDDQHRIPGEGNINWPGVMKRISETGYSGYIALEITNEFMDSSQGVDAEKYLSKAYSAANRLSQVL